MQKTLKNSNLRQSDTNKKYSGTHFLLKGEEGLENCNSWIVSEYSRTLIAIATPNEVFEGRPNA